MRRPTVTELTLHLMEIDVEGVGKNTEGCYTVYEVDFDFSASLASTERSWCAVCSNGASQNALVDGIIFSLALRISAL